MTLRKNKINLIRKHIYLVDGIEMSDELFEIKSKEFAKHLINVFGLEIINKLDYYSPLIGEHWNLCYFKNKTI
jgi:hypothetical protein